MVRDWRGREMKGLTPTNEAFMFSIYYAAITSMEEEDVSQFLSNRLSPAAGSRLATFR